MRTVPVQTASGSYEVRIGPGLLDTLGEEVRRVTRAKRCLLAVGENVFALYGDRALQSLRDAGLEASAYVLEPGEQSKCLRCYGELLSAMADRQLSRTDCVIALGGGVTGDLAGFAAATYQRGIDYIQVPTTLLAAVDSSVGGKTAIDLPQGKNQVGAFWQPNLVLCDIDTLSTLPDRQLRAGFAEVIKYAILEDADLFDRLGRHEIAVEETIEACVRMKAEIVAEDERDTGRRRMLNLGHTFGHAVEASSEYGLLHGEAVSIGMAMIARAAVKKSLLDPASRDAMIAILQDYGLPTETERSPEELMHFLLLDKKLSSGRLNLIVPRLIGWCEVVPVELAELREWLEAACE